MIIFKNEVIAFSFLISNKPKENIFLFFGRLCRIFWRQIFIKRYFPVKTVDVKNRNLIVVDSYNNYLATLFLLDKLSECIIVLRNKSKYDGKYKDVIHIQDFYTPSIGLRFFLFSCYLFFNRKFSTISLDSISDVFDLGAKLNKIFSSGHPKSLHFSNDINGFTRTLMLYAQNNNIKSFYYQHASTSEKFPSLIVTAAFLWGQYYKDLYNKAGGGLTEIYLTGMQKLDRYRDKITNRKYYNAIGVAYNLLDDIHIVESMIYKLRCCFPDYRIIVRPHPRDSRRLDISSDKCIEFSYAESEYSIDFCLNVKYLISGSSTILLEAALVNTLPIQVNIYKKETIIPVDYYGFISEGAVLFVNDIADISKIINNKTQSVNVRSKAKVYDCSIGTSFEFKVEDKVFKVLKETYNIH